MLTLNIENQNKEDVVSLPRRSVTIAELENAVHTFPLGTKLDDHAHYDVMGNYSNIYTLNLTYKQAKGVPHFEYSSSMRLYVPKHYLNRFFFLTFSCRYIRYENKIYNMKFFYVFDTEKFLRKWGKMGYPKEIKPDSETEIYLIKNVDGKTRIIICNEQEKAIASSHSVTVTDKHYREIKRRFPDIKISCPQQHQCLYWESKRKYALTIPNSILNEHPKLERGKDYYVNVPENWLNNYRQIIWKVKYDSEEDSIIDVEFLIGYDEKPLFNTIWEEIRGNFV